MILKININCDNCAAFILCDSFYSLKSKKYLEIAQKIILKGLTKNQ